MDEDLHASESPSEVPEEREPMQDAEVIESSTVELDVIADAPSMRKAHHRRSQSGRMSFRTRVVLNFVLISIITAGIAVGVVAFVWNNYYNAYTASNAESIMDFSADRIAGSIQNNDRIVREDIETALEPLAIFSSVSVAITDSDGDLMLGTHIEDGEQTYTDDLDYNAATKMAVKTVEVGDLGEYSIRVWAYDPALLMSGFDLDFRDKTYEALLGASLVAVMIASILGVIFVRLLIGPVNRITRAARAVSVGDFTARSDVAGNDEIARLGKTFDSMVESLEKNQKLERRLTSDMAHELRTPLMAIQANLEAMIDGVYPTDIDHLSLLNIEVKRLSKLVDALLRLSRLENRTVAMNEETTNLGDLVEEIVIGHELLVKDSGLDLRFEAQKDVIVMCDTNLIRQAVVNLLSNAVRYTPEGGTVTLRVRKDHENAMIDVEDTGIGLSPEDAKMVFSRFWRADSARKQESGGLGVGLTMVKEIVQRHNGNVQASGEVDKGAIFTITLPLYDVEASKRKARDALKSFERKNSAPRLRSSR